MNPDQLKSLIRTLLKMAGAYLAGRGLNVDDSTTEAITGGVIALAGIIWSQMTHTKPGDPNAQKWSLFLFVSFVFFVVPVTGCALLQKGANPIVVRVEQTEAIAYTTLDTALKIDDANRPFFKTNAPPFHQFCEQLRAPVQVGQVYYPRGVAGIKILDNTKLAYQAGQSSSNALITALATVETFTAQAQQFIVQINSTATTTNTP